MKHIRSIMLASIALVIGNTAGALAADLGPEVYKSDVEASYGGCCEGFYFKGFTGMTNQRVDDITSDVIANGDFSIRSKDFESSPLFGIGVGYEWNQWLRFDVTGEYRGNATFHGADFYAGGVGFGAGANQYTAVKEEWLGLANAYFDLGTWCGLTPYVGGGIGWTDIEIKGLQDINTPQGALFVADDNSESNFAWALYAGVSYDVTERFSIDLAYRYTDLGDASSGRLKAFDGSPSIDGIDFEDLESHDLMFGARWKFGGGVQHASYK